jgi:Tfp pilus assembly protein PilN
MEASQGNLLTILMGVWGVITALLIILLIYRSTLESREGDQVFLDAAEQTMAQEQAEIVERINRLSKPIMTLIVLSGVLLLGIAGLWLWQGYKNF